MKIVVRYIRTASGIMLLSRPGKPALEIEETPPMPKVTTVPKPCWRCKGNGYRSIYRCIRCGGRGTTQSAYLNAIKVDTAWWQGMGALDYEPQEPDGMLTSEMSDTVVGCIVARRDPMPEMRDADDPGARS